MMPVARTSALKEKRIRYGFDVYLLTVTFWSQVDKTFNRSYFE